MNAGLRARVTAVTHRGRVRADNEDTIAVGQWVRNAPMEQPAQSVHDLASPLVVLVADGMGGYAAGEEASRLTAFHLSNRGPDAVDEKSLSELVRQANRAVFDAMSINERLRGMGTTLVGVVFQPTGGLYVNVGDSRLYRLRDGFLRQLSVDDVAPQLQPGSPPQVQRSHGVTQCLGGADEFVDIAPHVGTEPIVPGWRYLLCSDGLTDMVGLDEIKVLTNNDDETSVNALLQAALNGGGADNVSIVMIAIEATSDPSDRERWAG